MAKGVDRGGNEKEGVLFVDNDALAICCETGEVASEPGEQCALFCVTKIERRSFADAVGLWVSTMMLADEPSRRAGSATPFVHLDKHLEWTYTSKQGTRASLFRAQGSRRLRKKLVA